MRGFSLPVDAATALRKRTVGVERNIMMRVKWNRVVLLFDKQLRAILGSSPDFCKGLAMNLGYCCSVVNAALRVLPMFL